MSIADALSAARLTVAKAEAAGVLDVGAGEASATLGAAQAGVAYQLVMQILQDKVVELAPALIAVEFAAINEGIAAYLAEQQLSLTIEKGVLAKTDAAFEQAREIFETDRQRQSAAYQAELTRERYADGTFSGLSADVPTAVQEALDEGAAAARSALGLAASSIN